MKFYEWAMTNGYENTLFIDRINSNSDYKPSNCRWVTKSRSSYLRFNRDLEKTCKRGHPWKKETTFFYSSGRKACKICVSERSKNKRKNPEIAKSALTSE